MRGDNAQSELPVHAYPLPADAGKVSIIPRVVTVTAKECSSSAQFPESPVTEVEDRI